MSRHRTGPRLAAVAGGLALVVLVATSAVLLAVRSRAAAPVSAPSSAATSTPTAATPGTAPPAAESTSSTEGTDATEPTAAPSARSVEAYRGLGTWVDIYDERAWKDPAAAVADMSSHGVRTLYVETGNSGAKSAIFKPAEQREFIREAHARGMFVVAWYLPTLKDPALDYERVAAAIVLRTADGQQFDSFALDIESGAVQPVGARNKALEDLALRIRELAGPAYPLGAIIPSPVGLSRKGGYWPAFPYGMLARTYDVFLPMSYYTYHGEGGPAAYADTLGNVRILRAQPGCERTPIHLIGGLSEASSPYEVEGFVRACRETSVLGAGLYGWTGTGPRHWQELAKITP